jgi:Vam6/Vps39-like protein vacuolar protein sorting-associated protein 39
MPFRAKRGLIYLQIFTADEAEVEALPRHQVLHYLEKTDADACIAYLEHIIDHLGEGGPDFHDKLAELYLAKARERPQDATGTYRCPRNELRRLTLTIVTGENSPSYIRLLKFLGASTQFRPDRLIGRLEQDGA